MQKKFIHQEKEVCKICNKEINTKIDDWVAVVDFKGKTQIVAKFYHRKCLDDLFKGKGEVIRKNFEEKLKSFTKKMFGSIGVDNKQVESKMVEVIA